MKRICKYILAISAFAFGVTVNCNAKVSLRSILIEHKDYTITNLSMEQGMTSEFRDGMVVMSSSRGSIAFQLSDLRNWTFSTEEGQTDAWNGASIDDISSNSEAVTMTWRDDVIVIDNLPLNTFVGLSDLNGCVISRCLANGRYEVQLSALLPDVYVLTVGNKSFKIAVR